MKNNLILGALLAFLLILQSTVLTLLNYKGAHADVLLLLVVSGGLLKGKSYGASLGFAAGLLQDLSSGTFFGMNTLAKILIGYSFGLMEKSVSKDYVLIPFAGAAVGTTLHCLFTAAIVFLLGYSFSPSNFLLYKMLPVILQNMLLIYPIYKTMRWICQVEE